MIVLIRRDGPRPIERHSLSTVLLPAPSIVVQAAC